MSFVNTIEDAIALAERGAQGYANVKSAVDDREVVALPDRQPIAGTVQPTLTAKDLSEAIRAEATNPRNYVIAGGVVLLAVILISRRKG